MYRWSGQWLQEGCMKNEMESNASMTVCECNYLAHFAILISPGAEVSKHRGQTLGECLHEGAI